ncbi:MAG: extracellular solute-binding protein, partial [Turicibacter sp.]
NSYLSNGLARNDLSVVEKALAGELDTERFTEYAEWVNLLFDYSNQTVLTTGNYDDQVGAFANQKAAFVHQGNWIDPNIADLDVPAFNRAYAPQGSSKSVTDGIFYGCPSWYVVNKDSKFTQEAKDFLTYLGTNEAGHDFVINDLGAAPAFNNVKNKPESSPLSMSIMEWAEAGKTYAWNQYYLPESFREALGPIYGLLAQDAITVEQFVEMMAEQFATLK